MTIQAVITLLLFLLCTFVVGIFIADSSTTVLFGPLFDLIGAYAYVLRVPLLLVLCVAALIVVFKKTRGIR